MSEVAPLKSANELVAEMRGEDEDSTEHKDDPKAQKEYSFDFEHKESGTGKLRKGKFTSTVLTIGMKRQVGLLQAQLSGGLPWASLSPYDRNVIGQLAHLSVSLTKRPPWAKDFEKLYDDAILDKLYEEVALHEATFHGRGEDQEEGAGSDESGAPDGGSDAVASGEASAE
jgi:hypothetical protein